jgi:hypothetical protein
MHCDGAGLYLQVKEVQTKKGPSLAKSWVFRYAPPDRSKPHGARFG